MYLLKRLRLGQAPRSGLFKRYIKKSITLIMIKEIEVKVTGRVQGMMFRDFTQRKASGLNIVGTVQNMKDGSVHIIAVGEEDTLKIFLQKIHRGSLLSRVDGVETIWKEPVEHFTKFAIIYS